MKLPQRALFLAAVCVALPGASVAQEPRTRAETSGFQATSTYQETLAFVRALEARSPRMKLLFYGTSGEGRPMPLVVVSQERAFTAAEARRLKKPIVLVQNGIHAGEI